MPKQQEKSVEEIVEELEVDIRMAMISAKSNPQMPKAEHYQELLYKLTQTLTAERKRCDEMVEAERERCIGIVKDYGESMSKLHQEMIGVAHEDSKIMLAFDMHSRLIAVKHITEKLTQPTPLNDKK